jgi:penicillin G amidase
MRGSRAAAIAALALAAALPAGAGAETLRAQAVLPPGQSGFVSLAGLPTGTGSPHLTDQVDLFTTFRHRSLMFDRPGGREVPRPGVEIVRDEYGVPSISAQSEYDAWWGVGYAVAQDRLFQLELFKRATSGRLAEILGSSFLDDDLIARRDYYTDAEVDRMLARVPRSLQARTAAYRDGINAWIEHVRANPEDLPGEFTALGVPLSDWSVRDTARVGVFLARTVPSGDGNELANARCGRSRSTRSRSRGMPGALTPRMWG